MALRFKVNQLLRKGRSVSCRLPRNSGNILVYIVMVMVIFSLLGAAMVSLFSTSISSSAIRNDTRRATYLSESGIRYAMSELRAADFDETAITSLNKNFLNDDYKMSPTETFGLNIFSPWFESASSHDAGTQLVDVDVLEGRLPEGYLPSLPVGDPDFLLVNYNYFDLSNPDVQSPITSFGVGSPTSFQIQLSDDLVTHINEQVALAVTPFSSDQDIPSQGYLDLKIVAKNVFPVLGGAFTVKDKDFYYKRVDPAIDDRVRLLDVALIPGQESGDIRVAQSDPVILTPLRNRLIVSEGRSGEVTFGNNIDYAASIVDHSLLPKSRKADINFEEETFLENVLSDVSTNTSLFSIDNDPGDKLIIIGAGPGPAFGATWFKDTRSIGGQRNFCSAGRCQFGQGIRAFFTFTLDGNSGEGFIFSLSNGQENTFGSVGGDIQQSELLGYSGDSRQNLPTEPDPNFLDGSGRGLQAPKIGVEFDTRVNYSSAFEQNQRYCSGDDLNENTRNDPLSSDKHAIQYVFWAKDNLNLPCRTTLGSATYDDNRHDAVGLGSSNWTKNLSGNTNSDPIIRESDGTIYIGSAATNLFAFKPDGTDEWAPFSDPTGEVYSPVLADGRIYVGSEDGRIYALNPSNGGLIKSANSFAPVRTKPAVDSAGFVYVTSGQSLLKFNFDNSPPTFETFNPGAGNITSSPAISLIGLTVYAGFSDGRLYARRISDLSYRWTSGFIGQVTGVPAVAPDRFVFVSTSNGVAKINPDNGSSLSTFSPGATPTSSPTLSKDGSTVYVGFNNGRLYALNTLDLTPKWFFPTSGSFVATPEVDSNENIYFGSGNYVYALFADGSLKWEFDTGGSVAARPVIDQNGVVYIGSNSSGGRLLAINQYTEPRNYRQNFENPPKPELANNLVAHAESSKAVEPYYTSISNTNKWLKDGPWAVRLEVDRSPLSGDRADYTISAWIQQCTDLDCTNVRGTFFEDTRIRYKPATKPPNLLQSFELDSTNNLKFNTFLFGFTSAKRDIADDQLITIDNFHLSFIRPGDPEVNVE